MGAWHTAIGLVEHGLDGRKFGYTGRVRTGFREADRIARAVRHPACRPDAVLVSTFWWEKVKNFGDLLTPVLLREFGIVAVLTPPAEAALVGVGSLIQHLPESSAGVLWGTGLIQDERVDLPGVTALAVRGHLTRDRLGSPSVEALGDPGLLVDRLVRRPGLRHDVGVVTHYVHSDDAWLKRLVAEHDGSVLIIDVAQSPAAVAGAIASCRVVVSTSLHGMITADSLGVPTARIRMPRALHGGDFKFEDHESVVRPSRPRTADAGDVDSLAQLVSLATPADETAVATAKEALARAARRIPEVVRHRRVRSWQVPLVGRGRPVHAHV